MNYGLPHSVEIDGQEQEHRTDFRVILEIFEALNDPELDGIEKAQAVIWMFYMTPETITDYNEAIKRCFEFIDCGKRQSRNKKRVLDWEKDFEYIIAPVNRVLGYEARSIPYDPETNTGGLHWWTFLAAFMEIGPDCTLSAILNIRDKQMSGRALTKEEKKWYTRNADIVNLPQRYTAEEEAIIREWAGGE